MGVVHPRRPSGPKGVLIGIGIAAAAGLVGMTFAGAVTAGAADPLPEAAHMHAVVMDPASAPSPLHGAPLAGPELPATAGSHAALPALGGLALVSAYRLSRSDRVRPARS